MEGLKDLFTSGRGIFALLLVLIAAAFAFAGQITFNEWKEFALYVYGIFAVAKTTTTVAGFFKAPAPTPQNGAL